MKENEVVILSNDQILELEEIILDNDTNAAFRFLKENVYSQMKKEKGTGCKPEF